MPRTIRLTVQTGPHQKKRFCFRDGCDCIAGRASDCFVNLSGTERDLLISRHHCRLAVVDGVVEIHDLGSRNGTYLDGDKVKDVLLRLGKIDDQPLRPCGCDMEGCDGRMLTIGGTTLRMDVVDCPPADAPPSLWSADQSALRDCPHDCHQSSAME